MNASYTAATATSAILYMVQPGDVEPAPLGVLLLDPVADQLFIRFRDDLGQVVRNDDDREILAEYPAMLADWGSQLGGKGLLDQLQDKLSNVVRIGALVPVERPANWENALDELLSQAMKSDHHPENT